MATSPATIEKLPKGRVKAVLTFAQEDAARAEESTLQKLGTSMTLPGFRSGHAPAHLVREKVGADQLFEETIRTLLTEHIPAIVREHNLAPILPPRVEAESRDPLRVSITFVLRPEVKLKELAKSAFAKKEITVTPEQIDRVLEDIKKQEKIETLTEEVVKEQLKVPSLAELRSQIERGLRAREEHAQDMERRRTILEELRKATSVELAPELLDTEVDELLHMFTEDLKRQNLTFDQWKAHTKKDLKELRAEFVKQAEERLTTRFGMLKMMEEKNIQVSDADVTGALTEMTKQYSADDRAKLQQNYQPGSPPFEELRWRMQVEKLFAELLK